MSAQTKTAAKRLVLGRETLRTLGRPLSTNPDALEDRITSCIDTCNCTGGSATY